MMGKFWIVRPESFIKKEMKSLREAQKLATKYAKEDGCNYVVFEAVGVVEPIETPVEWREL